LEDGERVEMLSVETSNNNGREQTTREMCWGCLERDVTEKRERTITVIVGAVIVYLVR